MVLWIDGHKIEPKPDQSLLDMIAENGLDRSDFANRPIAAQIAGEVFNLNYIPIRSKDVQEDRVTLRRAVAASEGKIRLLRYTDPAGKDVYRRTAYFLVFLAMHQLWPNARAMMGCTLGSALYIEVQNAPDFRFDRLKAKVAELIQADFSLIRKRTTTANAIAQYALQGQTDKSRLLSMRQAAHFDQYVYGDFADYFYGELAPSSGYVQAWDIQSAKNGFLFLFPDDYNPNNVGFYTQMPKFMGVHEEGEQWCRLMSCETVADLNEMVENGKIRELIRVNEALHEKRFSQVADMICERGAKAVMLAGPSSSGKTTSANRLATQLRVHGKKPILLGLDDYYFDRDMIPVGLDGKRDLEHINTIDTALFGHHLKALLDGNTVEIPSFNFVSGKREWNGHLVHIEPDTVIIIEGLHALNPALLPDDLDRKLVFRFYVSAMLPLNLDDHNRIPSNYLRLLRRMVRDLNTRGTSVSGTAQMWDSVRRGEERWIFPYQENADVIFNSSTLYELAVLKKYVYPLLLEIDPEDDSYETVRSVVKILNYVKEADVENEIPPTSLVREFIGGNHYYQ